MFQIFPFRSRVFKGAKTEKYLRKLQGSLEDPFSLLGIVALLFFISISFIPFSNNVPVNESSSFFKKSIESFGQASFSASFLESTNSFFQESPNFLLVEKNSLKATTPPALVSARVLGALVSQAETEERKEIEEYIVEGGDTLSNLAEKFDISLESILWANDLTKKSVIKPGQKLIIPPVSGVIYHVKSGDTLSEIAETYKANLEEIKSFNELSDENDIYIGDILIIPNGIMPPPPVKFQSIPVNVPLAESQFILPVSSPYLITQGLHWYNAIDFSHQGYACGKPVFAVAGGTVQKVGLDNVYGNYVRILHPNGVVALYAHLATIIVKTNDVVNVGDKIGSIGNTGRTRGISGCHLHFEVRGAQNPFAK